jgi:hypothetical protein
MKIAIGTWEDARSGINLKKSVFYILSFAVRLLMPQCPTVTKDITKGERRAKSFEQYVMLVETDVVDGLRGILP